MSDSQLIQTVRDLARLCAATARDCLQPVEPLTPEPIASGTMLRFGRHLSRCRMYVHEDAIIASFACHPTIDPRGCRLMVRNVADGMWYAGMDLFLRFHRGRRIVLTGHGVGGAIALIIAERLKTKLGHRVEDCVTFGAPRVYGHPRDYEPALSVINEWDTVPWFPAELAMSRDIWLLTEDGSIDGEFETELGCMDPAGPIPLEHDLDRYLDRLTAAAIFASEEKLEGAG